MLLAFAACGPSNAELRTAKTAVYADGSQVFAIAEQAAGDENYKLVADEGHLTYETVPKWYSPEGDLQSAGADNYTTVNNNSVKVSFIVAVTSAGAGQYVVTVTPHTWQYVAGSPQMRELEPNDPYLPPWVIGRADTLSLSIYDRAKGLALKPVGST
ncbi:MAG TPA: hypothetical protein VIV58_30240 [Kofleriaceae bacterium]